MGCGCGKKKRPATYSSEQASQMVDGESTSSTTVMSTSTGLPGRSSDKRTQRSSLQSV